MIHQLHLLVKRAALFILLACVPTQYTHGLGRVVGEMLDGMAVITAVSGATAIGIGGYSAYKVISNYVNRPSQTDCNQIIADAKKIIIDDTGSPEFFEKLAQCHKLYGNPKNTLKYTDEKK